MWSEPITDRSQSDISYAKENQNGSTDNKGALNYNDLNRIENNFKYLIEKLESDAVYIQHIYRNFKETVYEVQEVELPYTPLEYIESSGTQWIDTGIKLDTNSQLECTVAFLSVPDSHSAVMGARGSSNTQFWIYVNSSTEKYTGRMGGGTDYPADTSIFSETKLFLTHSVFKANDIEVPISSSTTSFNTNRNCYIFANNNNGNVQYKSTFRLYGAKIYSNGSLVRDYVPAKDSDNKACLYDNISKTFFYSESGDFTAGSVIDIEDKVVKVEKTFTDWQEECSPWTSEINRIRSNYNNLTAGYLYGLGFPVLEDSDYLTFEEVNTWESIALKCKDMIENMEKSYIYCGTIQSGGGILL